VQAAASAGSGLGSGSSSSSGSSSGSRGQAKYLTYDEYVELQQQYKQQQAALQQQGVLQPPTAEAAAAQQPPEGSEDGSGKRVPWNKGRKHSACTWEERVHVHSSCMHAFIWRVGKCALQLCAAPACEGELLIPLWL
jgi:hypothetical protein